MSGRYFVRKIHPHGEEWIGSGWIPKNMNTSWWNVVHWIRQLEMLCDPAERTAAKDRENPENFG